MIIKSDAQAPRRDDWIAYHATMTPDKMAQIDLPTGRSYTYLQMHERIGRVSALLQANGVSSGDRVGYLALNSTDILDLIFACWRIGAVALALNNRLSAPELAYIVNDANPTVLLVGVDFFELASELKTQVSVQTWITTGSSELASDLSRQVDDLDPILVVDDPVRVIDLAMLMYSSGTTGRPKGVMITHEMMQFSAINALKGLDVESSTVSLAVMPLFHIGGVIAATNVIYAGGTVVVGASFEPGQTLDLINDPNLGITSFIGVPAMYNAMKSHPKVAQTDFSRLENLLAGAEKVPIPLAEWWNKHVVPLQEGFGMTESTASTTITAKSDALAKVGSVGRPMFHSEIRLVRPDGVDAKTNELGEIWLRGPTVTPGYWNNEKANASSFSNGWFRTGDIARRDEDGFYYIEDRLKDMYISGGENVYPAEVERIIYSFNQVVEAAIIGVPDSKWGETGCAVVVLAEGSSLTLSEIHAACAAKLAKFKRPNYLVIVETLPRNATGKVLKYELRQRIPEQLDLR